MMSWISAYASSAAQFIQENIPAPVSEALSAAREKVSAAFSACFRPPEGYPYDDDADDDSEGDPVELVRQQTERENLELQMREIEAREAERKQAADIFKLETDET